MNTNPSGIAAVIHVAAGGDWHSHTDLLRAAYRASRAGIVLLIVSVESRSRIDRALDSIVMEEGIDVRGIRYVDESTDIEWIADLRPVPPCVHAGATPAFENVVYKLGIEPIGEADGIALLRSLEQAVESHAT